MGRIKKDHLYLIGISFKSAPVEIREKLSFDNTVCSSVLNDIYSIDGIEECVLLSTCNRTEIYLVINQSLSEVRERIEGYLLEISGSNKEILNCFYHLQGEDVIEHLFKVSSGLDSMILGEPQIFGQVKNAYSIASDIKCTGPVLNRLFHHTFSVGKLIRNSTKVGEGAMSVSYAAVNLAKNIFETLRGRSVLLIGAGKIGEICAKRLIDTGVAHLYIVNRTLDRAKDLAIKLRGDAIPFKNLGEIFKKVDIIITSVTSKVPIIKKSDIMHHIDNRKSESLFLIDLGVPRNIESEAGKIDNTFLYNIDDLEGLTLDNLDKRNKEVEKAEKFIQAEIDDFCSWLTKREVSPMIRDLYQSCENIRLKELEKVKNKISPEAYEILDIVTRRTVRKILHNPVITMRASKSGSQRERLLESIQELFIQSTES